MPFSPCFTAFLATTSIYQSFWKCRSSFLHPAYHIARGTFLPPFSKQKPVIMLSGAHFLLNAEGHVWDWNNDPTLMHTRIVQHINLLRRKNISKFSFWGLNPHCCLGVLAFSTNAERKQSPDYYCCAGYWMPCRVICAWCLTRGPCGPASVQDHFIGTAARCHSSEEHHRWYWCS